MFSRAEGQSSRRPAAALLEFIAGAAGVRIVPPNFGSIAPRLRRMDAPNPTISPARESMSEVAHLLLIADPHG